MAVIQNGLDHERFTPASASAAKLAVAKQFGLDKPFVLYTARLEHPGKNHVRLIAAFNEFKAATRSPWCLALAGADWHGAVEIHAAARAPPFAADIRRLGFVMPQHLPDLYRAAELFAFPSLYEGFGFPPVEAMACGCPVMSSTRGALGEVVGEAAALVEPEDVSAMVRSRATPSGATNYAPQAWHGRGDCGRRQNRRDSFRTRRRVTRHFGRHGGFEAADALSRRGRLVAGSQPVLVTLRPVAVRG